MPKYSMEIGGKTYDIESDRPLSDTDLMSYASKITAPTTPIAPVRPERTMGQALGDTGVQLAEGVNTLLGSGFSLFAPEGDIAKSFERGAEYWREKQSEPFKQRMAAADVSIQKAGEEGVISQIVEAASQYYDDPALAARFVVTNLPSMIPGLGVAKLTQAAALARGATAAKAAGLATTSAGGVNAILNAGGARAEAFQDIKKTLIEQGYSPAEAERKAIEDSRLVAAVGGATGFISGKTGLEKVITGGLTKGGLRGVAGRVAGELAGEQAEEVLPKLATNIQAAEYDARSLGKDIGRTIVETGIASGPGAALSGVMGRAPEAPITDKSRAANTVEQTPDGQLKILVNGVADTPPVAPEVQEVRDRLTARGFSEEDIDRILAERAMREAPAAVKEPTDATATTLPADVPAVTEAQPGVGEPSVGVPSGDLGRPTTAEPAAPVGRGLERPVTPPAPRVEPETTIPTELTETPRGTQAPETIQAKEEGSAQPAAPAPTAVEAPAPTPPVTTPKATDLLRGLTRETRIPGMEGERVADPVAQDILKTRGAENLDTELANLGYTPTGVIGAGAGSVVLDAGDSVVRLGVGEATPVPKVSGVLQPITSGNIGTIRYDVMPKVDTTGVTQKHVEQLTSELEQQGYKFSDAGIDNVGLIKGVPYVIDPGAITKAQPAASAPTAVEAPAATPPVEEKPARYQRLRAEQPWYSALDKAIEASPQKAAPAPQWKNVLTGMVNKGQAKRDEIEWTGVEDWLALQQGRVTKEQVQDYLKQGGVKVEETVLGENKDALSRIRAEWAKLPEAAGYSIEYDPVGENYEYIDPNGDNVDQLPAKLQEAVNKHFSDTSSDTKYGGYTLPGGQNYREVLLTLPIKKAVLTNWRVQYVKGEDYDSWTVKADMPDGTIFKSSYDPEEMSEAEALAAAKQLARKHEVTDDKSSQTYQSSHWDQPNVLAHIRVNDRTDADGKKVLFVEEIQSDWGQEGKKKGFRREEDPRIAALKEQREQWLADPEKRSEVWQLNAEINRLGGSITPGGETGVVVGNVPTAPFVTKTEGWLNLALKRVLTMAAEGGYDRVAFINGAQAHRRFPKKEDGTSTKESFDKYYNQIIPQALNKLLPKLGGGRAATVPVMAPYKNSDERNLAVNTFREQMLAKYGDGIMLKMSDAEKTQLRNLENGKIVYQPGFDITPAMREKLAGGLPLFQKEGKEQPPQKTGKYPLPAQAIEDLKGNNLALALEAIETSKPSEINKAIATRLKVLLKNTKVTIDDDLRDSKGNPVLGAASTSGSRIWLDVNRGMNMETVLHESVHAATERILSTPENQRTPQQNEAVRELTDLWNAAKANSAINLTPEASDSLSEFVAEGMTNIELQDQLASVKWESRTMWAGFKRILLNMLGVKTPASMLDYTLASVDTIFAAVPKAAAPTSTPAATPTPAASTAKTKPKEEPKVLQKPKLTAEEKAKKEAEEADAKVTEALEKFAKSKTSEEAAKAASTLQSLRSSKTTVAQLRRLYDSGSDKAKRALLIALPTEFVAEMASKDVPELQRTTELLSRMSGMTEQLIHGASQTSDRMYRAFKKDPLLRARLEKVVYASTLAQIDPSTNKTSEKLNTLYKALGEEGQTIYKDTRDYYVDLRDLYSQLIKTNVERSGASEESKTAILAKLKELFEPSTKMHPYFPLMRRGDYWFSSGKGKSRRSHMFESMPERDAALEAFARSEGKSLQDMKESGEVKFGNDVASLREINKDTDKALSDVLALVEKLDTGSAASKQNLLDSVYQIYLHSLPEQSFRKHYVTRQDAGRAGFSTDILRNFSQSAIQMSGQLARVKYGPQIRSSLLSAKASIENQPQYEPYVEEMTKRAELDLVPPARTTLDAVADATTKASFMYYMSSISSALMQPLGIVATGASVLGARHGYIKTAVEIAKLAKIWDASFTMSRKLPDGSTTITFPTIVNSKAIITSPDEKQAVKEMLARDVSQSTMAREMYGYRAKPTDQLNLSASLPAKTFSMLFLGGLMHHMERISREIVFLTSYRLNIAEQKSHKAAADAAVKDTTDSLGNFSQYARPRIMRNPGGKVALQYSGYSLWMISFLSNNFYKMLPLAKNKEGKAEAAKIFFGTLGTTWILAGIAGFPAPVTELMMGFISAMFSMLGDDEEMPDEMRKQNFTKWFNEILIPSELGRIEVFGNKLSDVVKTGPLSAATGWDFASRASISNLLIRDQKETKTFREALEAFALERIGGPSLNMILNASDGAQAFKEGDYQRAVEKVAPASVRSIAQTYRFATEGAKDVKGSELITEGSFTKGELLGRLIGFQPSKLANLQKSNAEANQEIIKMTNARDLILRKYDIAKRKDADLDSIFEEIDAYNAKYPTNAISGFALSRYLKDKAKERAKSQQGVTVTKKTPIDVREMIDLSR